MVRLRLRRVGGKGQPSYRVIATDKESPRDGRFLEIIGFYNPRTEPATIQLKEDRVYDWMSKGAQPTESVAKIFKSCGLMERFERFKKGEDVAVLLEEAASATSSREVSQETHEVVTSGKTKKAKSAK